MERSKGHHGPLNQSLTNYKNNPLPPGRPACAKLRDVAKQTGFVPKPPFDLCRQQSDSLHNRPTAHGNARAASGSVQTWDLSFLLQILPWKAISVPMLTITTLF